MKLISTFFSCIYRFDNYKNLIKKRSVWAAIAYYVLFALIIGVVGGGYPAAAVYKAAVAAESALPEFKLEDGCFSAEEQFYEDFGGIIVSIDPKSESYADMDLDEEAMGFYISKNDMCIKYGGMTRTTDFNSFTGTLADTAIYRLINFSIIISLIISYIFYMLILYVMFALVAKLMSNIFNGGFKAADSFKAAAYCLTFPVILFIVLMYFGFMPPKILFGLIACVYIYFAIIDCKKEAV